MPRRARLDPGDYPWSSYRVNGQGEESGFIVPHGEYHNLSNHRAQRLEKYRNLFRGSVQAGLTDKIRTVTNGNFVLGNDKFKQEIEKNLNRRVSPGKSGRPILKVR